MDGLLVAYAFACLPPKVRILCFKFSLNPLRFSFTRETDTKMSRAKSWANCRTSIIEWWNWPKHQFCQMVIFAVLYCFAQLLAVVNFSRERKSERIERKFKTQNPNPRGHRHHNWQRSSAQKWTGSEDQERVQGDCPHRVFILLLRPGYVWTEKRGGQWRTDEQCLQRWPYFS